MHPYYFELNEKGHRISCKYYGNSTAPVTRIVIFLHGFSGHKDNLAAERFAKHFLAEPGPSAVITFNLPCHGDDEKTLLRLKDCSDYLHLIISYAQEAFPHAALYSYATSFGGYLILKYISEEKNPFQKIALRCPAINMYDILTAVILSPQDLDEIQKGRSVAAGFDRKIAIDKEFLEDLRENDIRKGNYLEEAGKILILHGTRDEVVPFAVGRSFAEKNHIRFIPVEDADHRFQDFSKMKKAIRHILDFYHLY